MSFERSQKRVMFHLLNIWKCTLYNLFESCRFPSFMFLPFFLSFFFSAPVASKGVDDDLSAYIPGKNKKGYKGFVMKPDYSRKHTHFWSYITLQIPLLTTSFQVVEECPLFLCTPQPEVTWLTISTIYPKIQCNPLRHQREFLQVLIQKRFCHQGNLK